MMKTRSKSIIIILVTLLIGIAIGFEISEIMIKQRFNEFRRIREPKGFISIFDRIIKPDEKQKPIIDSIILKHHEHVSEIMSASRAQLDKQMDSLKISLKPYLTQVQMDRFNSEITKMKKGFQLFRRRVPPPDGRQGPPPQGPPPDFNNETPPHSNER